jgi:hypothetical protein
MQGETAVVDMKPATELNAQPPKFVPSQSGVAPAPTMEEEASLRQMFQDAAKSGLELGDQITVPAPVQGQPKPPAPAVQVPEKFKTPEGTVDEDKLKASSKQLDAAIEGKQKSIDEILAEYKAKERQFADLSQKKAELQKQTPQEGITNIPFSSPQATTDPQMAQIHQQLLADMQRDPVGTSIMLNQAIVQKEIGPLLERLRQDDEAKRDLSMRDGLARLAQDDSRILNPQYFAVVNQILDEDPVMMRLKNPHKAAWNEAKERLRLGEQARPSIPTPTLGGGAPPSVSTLPGSVTPQALASQAGTINPYSDEGKAFEERLRAATDNLWR